MQRRRWTLPLVLGLITAVLLVAVLWPKETPKRTVVVAARDLGAGTALVAADLTTTVLEAAQAPADAVADPAKLAGQTLAVVRFTGEPVTPRHLGPAVTLAPDRARHRGQRQGRYRSGGPPAPWDEGRRRGDAGRDRRRRPRGLRQDRAGRVAGALCAARLPGAALHAGHGVCDRDQERQRWRAGCETAAPATSSTGNSGTVREGVLVLAAGTQAQPIRYETTLPLTPTVTASASVTDALKLAATPVLTGTVPAPAKAAVAGKKEAEPPVRWVVPVELLAALNAQGNSFTLVLLPETPQAYVTAGLSLADLRALETKPEARR